MKPRFRTFFIAPLFFFFVLSCQKEEHLIVESTKKTALETKAITPELFDWETAEYMPLPDGQIPIPVPWIGSGSLAGSHTIDIINDYKKSDGWRLLYSTFSESSSGLIANPYFIQCISRNDASIFICNYTICANFIIFERCTFS